MILNRLERSMLFVPACRWPMIEKAARGVADAICLDLEDSVPENEKATGRANVVRAFRELDFGSRIRMFRINGLDTPFAYRDVIEVVEAAGSNIDVVMLPKAGCREDVVFLDRLLSQVEAATGAEKPIGVEVQIETAAGFLYAGDIARSSSRLEALIFGPGDFAASMQMPMANIGEFDGQDQLYPGHRWHTVMQTIVAAARANGLRCLDGPYAGYQDHEGFDRSCRIARALGFDGKQCIHPSQLGAANLIFSPPEEEVERAARVLDAVNSAAAKGHGAISLDGKMVDAANIRMARVLLEKRRLIEERNQ